MWPLVIEWYTHMPHHMFRDFIHHSFMPSWCSKVVPVAYVCNLFFIFQGTTNTEYTDFQLGPYICWWQLHGRTWALSACLSNMEIWLAGQGHMTHKRFKHFTFVTYIIAIIFIKMVFYHLPVSTCPFYNKNNFLRKVICMHISNSKFNSLWHLEKYYNIFLTKSILSSIANQLHA